ncbi:uridine diphosphate glucose pyrophosphatase NUDT14 [Bemisia tabaci]|nr:PREDICTED: uridine diphosphate glucose pyrophosphatase-like [Bemisia tabaci]
MTSVVTHTISDVKIVSMEKSQYVIPLSLLFKQNGVTRRWDIVRAHPSVVIIIFNTTRKVLVLVKQFRPAVYYGSVPEEDKKETIDALKYPAELGVTIEFCAGILDKDKSLEETAKEEVLEETGYEVEASSLQKIKTFRSSVGILGEEQTVFYVEVTDSMKKTEGGGVHDENIEVIEMTLDESEKYLNQEKVISSGGFLFVLQWFMTHKKPLFQ